MNHTPQEWVCKDDRCKAFDIVCYNFRFPKTLERSIIYIKAPFIGNTAHAWAGIDSRVPVYIVTAFHEEFFGEFKVAEKEGIGFDILRKPVDSRGIFLLTQSVLEGSVAYG